MNIVVEGIDNSGKSTLIKNLVPGLRGYKVQASEGPPKYDGEMNHRLKRYQLFQQTVFDRHPVVSQSIYRSIRTGHDAAGMDEQFVLDFYHSAPLFIYCDPTTRGMDGHTFNEGVDTEEHLRQVREGYTRMLTLYRAWAIQHAHFIYRIGDDMTQLISCVEHVVSSQGE